jgi:WD40 repeat protein
VAFSSDGKRLATASEDQYVKLWESASGSELATLRGHLTGVKDVAFAPDGKVLASVGGQYRGSPVSEVLIWDTATGGLVNKLQGHTSLVTALAYFPDGRRLATASDDRTIKLWDPITGDDVFTLRGHTSGVVSLAISGDGHQIVSGGIDCIARVWSSEAQRTDLDHVRRRAAVELVQSLFETHMLKSKVRGVLKSDPTINEKLRVLALEIAERRSDDAHALYEAAWLTVLRPGSRPELYAQALQQLEAACSVVSGDPDRLAEYQHALGLAFYRTGRPAEAIGVLDRLASQHAPRGATDLPIDLAVRAMSLHRLGRASEAKAALSALRTALKPTSGDGAQAAHGFLREAENAVGN